MEDYKSNSHRSKEAAAPPEKKVEKVVRGTVKTRKKSGLEKAKGVLISEDATNIKSYVVMDVLVPALKKAISDIVTNGIEIILYGESGRTRRNSPAGSISYRNFYDRRDDDRRGSNAPVRVGYSYDDVIIPSRGEAEDVLSRMDELIDTYGVVSVADLYEMVGVTGNYTDNKYGWTNIRNAEPIRVRDGYLLKLPKAGPIN